MMWRFSRGALGRLHDDLEMYWAEKSRVACHRNIISIYNLCKLYDTPVEEIPRLSETKYGVRYYCPDNGQYTFDTQRNQVVCSLPGNPERSRQNPRLDHKAAFSGVT